MSVQEVFQEAGFHVGRLVSASKTTYRTQYPDNEVIFNSNVLVESVGKVWYGDLDVTRDHARLQDIANRIGEKLYILSEMDARFENEKKPFDELKEKARTVIIPV